MTAWTAGLILKYFRYFRHLPALHEQLTREGRVVVVVGVVDGGEECHSY